MNFGLLQPVKKVKAGSKTLYIYAPSIVTSHDAMEPGEAIKVLDVFEGTTAAETTVKVMPAYKWEEHAANYWTKPKVDRCTRYTREEADDKCECEMELSEMREVFKANVYYILLTDIRK
jgi:hypothetical protein